MTESGTAAPGSTVWSVDQLRRAVVLAHGRTRTGSADVRPLAAALGVSPRTVQRWLSGQHRPAESRLRQLRDELLPDRLVLEQQRDERQWADMAAQALAVPRRRGVDPVWIKRNWHRPHRVMVLKNEPLGVCRARVELADGNNEWGVSRLWERVDVVQVPNRPAGLLVRAALLEAVAPWRVRVRRDFTDGHTVCWLAEAPAPLLSAVAHEQGWR